MPFIIISGVLVIIGVILIILDNHFYWYSGAEQAGIILCVLFGIALVTSLVSVIVLPYERKIEIQTIEQQRYIFENREEYSEFERVEFLELVINYNNWIISMQEKNKNVWFDVFIPDEIDEVKLIE